MSRIIEIIRRVVQQELAQQRGSLLGVVTSVFPHENKNDANNYEINLKLKHEDLELRKVPMAVSHIGVAAPPRVGDLVLVHFVNGDLNQPVVTGRFYHDGERPPLHKENEILFEHRVPDGTLNHLRFAADGSIYLQRDVVKPEDNTKANSSFKMDKDGNIEIKAGEKIVIAITNDDNIQITTGEKIVLLLKKDEKIDINADTLPVNVKCDKVAIAGNVEITGDLTVKNQAGQSTTISGHEIMGK